MEKLGRNEGLDRSSWLERVRPFQSRLIRRHRILFHLLLLVCVAPACNHDMPEDVDWGAFLSRTKCEKKKCDFSLYDPGVGSFEDAPSGLFKSIEDFPAWAIPLLSSTIAINSEFCDDPDDASDDHLAWSPHCGKYFDEEDRIWYNVTWKKWCGDGEEDDEGNIDEGYLGELRDFASEEGEPYVEEIYDEKAGVVFGDPRCDTPNGAGESLHLALQ